MGKKITEDNRKVLINDIIWCAEKRLGLDGAEVMQMIDRHLEKKYPNRTFGRYMPLVDARYFSRKFLTMIDVERANPLDLMSYQSNMKKPLQVQETTISSRKTARSIRRSDTSLKERSHIAK